MQIKTENLSRYLRRLTKCWNRIR